MQKSALYKRILCETIFRLEQDSNKPFFRSTKFFYFSVAVFDTISFKFGTTLVAAVGCVISFRVCQ